MVKACGTATCMKQNRFLAKKDVRAERQVTKLENIAKARNDLYGNKGKKAPAVKKEAPNPAQKSRITFADLEPFLRATPLDVLEKLAAPAEPEGAAANDGGTAGDDAVQGPAAFVPGDCAAYDPTSPEAKRGRERRRELVSAMKKAMPKHGLVSRRQAAWLEAAWVPSDDVLRCLLFDWKCAAPGGAELRFLRREVVLGGGQAPVAVARTVRVIEGSGRAVCQLTLEPEEGAAEGAVVTLVLERSFAGTMRLVGQCARSGSAPVVAIEAHLLS